MKIRTGFVSNSSSSSFLIAIKDGNLKDKFQNMLEGIKNVDDFPLKDLFIDYARNIISAFVDDTLEYTLESWIDDMCYDEEEFKERYPKIYDKVKNHGWKLYDGSVSNEDYENPASLMLVEMDINYEDDKIIIQKEGGY